MDAGRCLSTWTIEWRGRPPEGRAHEQGGILFGCDICQAVCPWNNRAAENSHGEVRPEYGNLADHEAPSLADLAELSDDGFRDRFRRTPLWRAHPDGLARNVRTVLENLASETD